MNQYEPRSRDDPYEPRSLDDWLYSLREGSLQNWAPKEPGGYFLLMAECGTGGPPDDAWHRFVAHKKRTTYWPRMCKDCGEFFTPKIGRRARCPDCIEARKAFCDTRRAESRT